MLKSTHQPFQPFQANQNGPLPPGWTQHTAPTGHIYYYNTETKRSTYQRPQPPPPAFQPPPGYPSIGHQPYPAPTFPNPASFQPNFGFSRPPPADQGRNGPAGGGYRRREPQDRPKSKHEIPGCAPWLLIKTRLGRRFVHNIETKESLWKFPQHVLSGVVEYDIQERQRRENRERGEDEEHVLGAKKPSEEDIKQNDHRPSSDIDEHVVQNDIGKEPPVKTVEPADEEEYDEIQEVEVTDDEDEFRDENPAKRLKTDYTQNEEDPEYELGEEDMAYQLAQMAELEQDQEMEDYGQDENEEELDGEGGEAGMANKDARTAFMDLLDDYKINPFTTWESVIDEGRIIEDYRYTLLPNGRTRKEVFADWSTDRIQKVRAEKEKQAELDPRIPYLPLLQKHATPKLYWPEFKRKYKKELEMKDTRLGDKEREKLYRDHINRTTKSSESRLKDDLWDLLRSIPPSTTWHCETTLDGPLPSALQADIRYISLKPKIRDVVIKDFIRSLPHPDETLDEQQREDLAQKKAERSKQEKALMERQRMADEAKRRRRRNMNEDRDALEREERELDRAMRVGREGLAAHFRSNDGPP